MSMLTIAIIAGIILCLVVLLVQRRKDRDGTAPASAGRAKGDRKRRRGKKAGSPPPPPEPMPLAAAGQSSAPAGDPGPAPDWSAAPAEPSVAEWPPAEDPEPIDWAPPADEAPAQPQAAQPQAAQPPPLPQAAPQPQAAAPPAEPEVGWPSDEIVTEPGWPIPGEVDVPWSTPAEEPVGAGAASGWSEQAATSAPPADLQWAPPEPVAEEIPQWSPPPEPVAEEIPQWSPPPEPAQEAPTPTAAAVQEIPVEEAPVWEAPAEEPEAGWITDEPPSIDDAQVTGEIPIIRDPAPEPEAEAGFEAEAEAGFELPDDPFAAAPPEPEAPAAVATPAAGEAMLSDSLEMEFPSFEEEEIAFEEFVAEVPVKVASEPAAAFVAAEPEEMTGWDDDLRDEAPVHAIVPVSEPVSEPVAAPVADDPSRTGRFAIGGFALQPGQQALGGVSFRAELPQAPSAWTVTDRDDLAPGTLVLQLDGTINCDASVLEVVTDPGFAPTPLGFTVRVAALASGPFAASGTFRVR